MERWARSLPHKQWWQRFVRDTGGTGFWHETYLMRGGMEAIYDDVDRPPSMSYSRSPHEPDPVRSIWHGQMVSSATLAQRSTDVDGGPG